MTTVAFVLLSNGAAGAQVFSPRVLLKNQIDTTTLSSLAEGICTRAGAVTPRQKADAIWRFFLTDGRFVAPGFWYHIAGWAYEEPGGEVLDAVKLINSYGFGLCYHIAPLLEAVYEAAGFEDARVWFLTGHTVTEVFYDGAYHYYDSDMLGYTTVGDGDPKRLPVASVSQIARDGSILTGKLRSPTEADTSRVDVPWYPADLREAAIGDLTSLFTSTGDNWLYPYARYAQGHSMDFVLRPGERLTRYYEPETPGSFYLPYRLDGGKWKEFPQEVPQYKVRTEDGPRSQKDSRRWATGTIEYNPDLSDAAAYYSEASEECSANLRLPDLRAGRDYLSQARKGQSACAVFEMQSPYVLIDTEISLDASLADETAALAAELSTDSGRTWEAMGSLRGPFEGAWRAHPPEKLRSRHGALTAVSGKYGYLVRLKLSGIGSTDSIRVSNVEIRSRFQHNPRTLPLLTPGSNVLQFAAGPQIRRRPSPVSLGRLNRFAIGVSNAKVVNEGGQMFVWPSNGQTASVLFELSSVDGAQLEGFDAGARFLDLRDGLAPDKFTAETRSSALADRPAEDAQASLAWSTSPLGPFRHLWEYDPKLRWKDGEEIRNLLRWPEVDRSIRALPPGTKRVFVRYSFSNMGLDSLRMATHTRVVSRSQALDITHAWLEDRVRREHHQRIDQPWQARTYKVETNPTCQLVNHALILSCPRQ